MARGSFYHDPARKHIEQYQDFSGGLNTMSSNDNVKDNELAHLVNVSLGARGSLTRRKGFQSEANLDAEGKAQMIHKYHRRYVPYNLLGSEGSFDGQKKKVGDDVSIGGWYAFNLDDEENAYKVDREAAEDLIYNGDLENGEDGWQLNVDDMNVGTSLMGKSTYAESGTNVFRLTMFKDHSGWLNEYQKNAHAIPVKGGDKFDAHVRYRRSALSLGGIPYRVHMIASVHFTDGRPVERIYIRAYDVSSKWQDLKGTFTMPSGASKVIFGLGMLDNDMSQDISVYFEDYTVFGKRSADLAINGNFENGETGWVLDAYKQEDASSVIGTSIYAYGEYVMRISIGQFNTNRIVNEYQENIHAVETKGGDIFDTEVMIRRAALSLGSTPYRSHIVASIHLKDGSVVRHYKGLYNTDSQWRKLSHSFTMPQDATKVVFGLGIYNPGTDQPVAAYFDNFKYYKREQLIINGDFEDNSTGWHLNIEDKKAGDSIVGYSSIAHSGENVMRIRRFKNNGGFYNEYQSHAKRIHVKEGDEIYAETHYRRGAAVLGIKPYRVHLIASIKFKDGTVKREYIRKYDASFTWKKISGYFKMPKNADTVRFGVGIMDSTTDDDVVAYFDSLYARKEIEGSDNSVLAIRSTLGDPSIKRGLGYRFDGLEPNKYYVFVVDYKSDGKGTGALAVRDERFGVFPNDNGLVLDKTFKDSSDKWVTKHMKFKTYEDMSRARAYVYNYSPLETLSTVYYDNARIYELKIEDYNRIDNDPEFTEELIGEAYPYRVGKLTTETITETVTAIGGTFFIDGVEMKVEQDTPIQTERIMEAAEYQNNLYIATGYVLLVYNGSTIAKVTPYLPDPLETLYIGSNAMIENPYSVNDEEQSVVELLRLQFSRRYGVTNQDITLLVGVGKPGNVKLEYKFERRNVRDKEDYWETIRDWKTDSSVTFKTNISGEYQFKISVRKVGEDVVLDDYEIPKYIIKPTDDPSDEPIDSNTLQMCNRILVHNNRLILYGDETKPDIVYMSDLYNPRYFPVNNTLQFENPRKERITSITKYRDILVIFTPSSIQALFGTNPENFERVMMNTDVGSIADRSVSVVQDYIIFLSYEGITLLKTVGQSESKANVSIIDMNIKDKVILDSEAVSYVRNNEYCLVFPNDQKQLRYYYEWGVWTYDESPSLDFTEVYIEDSKLYALGKNGRLITDSDDYADEGVPFESIIGTKMYSFGEPYATKKTRQLQIMFDTLEQDTIMTVDAYMDKAYDGMKKQAGQDYEHTVEHDEKNNKWVTNIVPTHPYTIRKGFANSEFGGSETISSFANRNQAFIAITGSANVDGLQVKDSVLYQEDSEDQEFEKTLAIYEDGHLGIIDTTSSLENIRHTVHAGPYLIDEGVLRTEFPESENNLHQKMARQGIGQRKDGSLVIITVAGGSEAVTEGATIQEFAAMFDEQDCEIAYNLGTPDTVQAVVAGESLNTYFDGVERSAQDFLYFTSDIVEVVESNRDGIIKSESIPVSKNDDIYKLAIPGKGVTVGSMITHRENKPVRIVGLGYVFKLKKP